MKNEILRLFQDDFSLQISAYSFGFNLVLTAVLAYLLSHVYTRYGNSISNRKNFGRNFVLLAVTTMLVISIVKSSLALSLGLVGALSIVRFRSAIKEPEELAYVFLAIALGLGLGAGQRLITLLAFVLIVAIIIATKLLSKTQLKADDMILHVVSDKLKLDELVSIISDNSNEAKLRRVDELAKKIDASFVVSLPNVKSYNAIADSLKARDINIEISLLDNQGLY